MDIKKIINQHHDMFSNAIKNTKFYIAQDQVSEEIWFDLALKHIRLIKHSGKSLFFLGNGASASIADHFATDFTKNGMLPCFSNTESALLTCFSNDYSYENAYAEILKRKMKDGDGLFVISSSGRSQNLIKAADYVKNHYLSSPIFTFTGFDKSNPLKEYGSYNLFTDTGEYSIAESAHAYFLHLLIDLFCGQTNSIKNNLESKCQTNIV